jgi:hypothetical protein
VAIGASAGHPDTYMAPNCCTRWHPSLAGLTKLARKSVRWARPNEVGDERRKFAACASPLDTHWNTCIARERKSLHTHVHPSMHAHEIQWCIHMGHLFLRTKITIRKFHSTSMCIQWCIHMGHLSLRTKITVSLHGNINFIFDDGRPCISSRAKHFSFFPMHKSFMPKG